MFNLSSRISAERDAQSKEKDSELRKATQHESLDIGKFDLYSTYHLIRLQISCRPHVFIKIYT